MAMDSKRARELLIEARHEFDVRAKEIVEGLSEDAEKEEFESRLADAISEFRGSMIEAVEEEFHHPLIRTLAAFEQWEMTEPCPLNEDESFMYALRDLLRADAKRAVDIAINGKQKHA